MKFEGSTLSFCSLTQTVAHGLKSQRLNLNRDVCLCSLMAVGAAAAFILLQVRRNLVNYSGRVKV